MKYLVMITALFLLGISKVKAQEIGTCLPYNQSRTLEQFRETILYGSDPFIKNELWPEYAKLANRALQTSKDATVRARVLHADLESMKWLMDNSVVYAESFFDWHDYENAGRRSNKLFYTTSKGSSSSWVGLHYADIEDSEGMYAKLACGNAENKKSPAPPYTYTPPPPVIRDSVVVRIKDSTIIRIKDSTITKPAITPLTTPLGIPRQTPNNTTQEPQVQQKKTTKINIVVAVLGGLGGGNYYRMPGSQLIRTMSGGIDAGGNGGSGGLGGDIRTMSGGIH